MRIRWLLLGIIIAAHVGVALGAERWISAEDASQLTRSGAWQWTSHRYAADSALVTVEDGAALEYTFTGCTLVLCLDTLTPPNSYGPPELGALEITIDGQAAAVVRPRESAGEVTLWQSAKSKTARVRIVHRADGSGVGARIRGLRVVTEPTGALAMVVNGEQNRGLLDVRAILTQGGRVVRDTLVRNWLTGACRLGALPPGSGYRLELRASGWKTFIAEPIAISMGEETVLPAVYFRREHDVPQDAVTFPVFGAAVVRQAGDSFRARFSAYRGQIQSVRLVRRVGPAMISRRVTFEEDEAAGFYYHREGTLALPDDVPVGTYDLEITIQDARGVRSLISPRAVTVVRTFPTDPVFVSWGHLDTWGQAQAEYVERLVAVANLLAPDMVLVSNEGNPAYAAGALYGLEMPFAVNFGNHRGPEPGPWFGDAVSVVDFGPAFTVLNFGRAWDRDLGEANILFSARSSVRTKIINAYESNAPVREFLDRHGVALIHYAHGPGPAVARLGETPTIRVGKVNSESFRVIRFRDGRPVSYTYGGHVTAPIPFPRTGVPPLALMYQETNDGMNRRVTARFRNELDEDFPRARAVFVMPRGTYQVRGAQIEDTTDSDDGAFSVITARFDLPRRSSGEIVAEP